MKGTQIDMKKKRFATIVAALLVISLASCSTPAGSLPSAPDGSRVPEKTQALYSNLTDDSSRREVVDALQAHGVSQEQTDTLLAWADDFNARVTTPTLTEGFTAMEGDFVDYSSLLFDIKELPDGTFFMEANCRLTAFLLMRDQLQTCGTADESDTYLMFGIEAIDTQKEYQLSSEARADFITLFNAVPLEGAANQEEHLARIEEAWSERGIQVDSAKGMSLIEVYLHSPLDGVRFVGHTGVLMETEDGLLFVEKYGPAGPFQATKFESRNALEHYLLARPDLYGDETELPPIVLENGKMMEIS